MNSREVDTSQQEEQYLKKLENEAIRVALPRGLLDEKGNELKSELHYCLTRNDWWFTVGKIHASSNCILVRLETTLLAN
jgi:hypothetical protein